jgi:ATP-dependent helicase/nuclease subunit A
MTESLANRVVDSFGLTQDQRTSALERGRDVIVTAGAGSGKTRTLVARYASLLADGLSPRKVVAITFTEKSAREMRSRLREALITLAKDAISKEEREQWVALNNQMDSARIGTIHSLCAEILRSHPAEAGIDPRFKVLDEGLAATLKNQVINDALKEMVSQPEYKILIQILQTDGVQSLLENVLSHRLDAQEIFAKSVDGDSIVLEHIKSILNSPPISEPIEILRRFTPKELIEDANENLALQVIELLKIWQQAESALKKGDMISCASHFFTARREKLKKGSGKKTSIAREAFSRLQKAYDDLLNPLIGGKNSKDAPPNSKSESLFKELQPLVQNGSGLVYRLYQAELTQRHALDYDDLEFGAIQLLRREDIRAYWQNEVKALLVDEFQDTNARQREIVELLAGSAGRLFVVGDARQSIYRFRRADVTVFRSVQEQAHQNNGLVLNLDITYRAHEPLLNAMGDLLAGVMGVDPDPARPYYVPFTPLIANRKTQPEYIAAPHVEFVFGLGEGASEARPFASRALAKRLLELKAENQIKTWDDVALLFRASTGYVYYEDAFEDADIPFVTVAGRGFYDRPEIRDVLNLLRALADPADDLAMAGLLRSPAFGLSDSALYQLRLQDENSLPYWTALQRDFSFLTESDQQRAYRTASILRELLPQVDRTPVPDLLSALVDITDYRAILASADDNASNGRLWRNLDKLISDAQKSGYVNVRDFLEYISILNDAGAREGEAPADAQGAVRLMTIHKSKGLEFPVIVLADAGRTPIARSDAVYLLPESGLSFKLDPTPMLYRLSKDLDKRQNEAETGRLLYVALTRAKDKLIISGHATSSSSIGTAGWMKEICEALKIDVEKLVHEAGTASEVKTSSGYPIRAWCMMADEIQTGKESQIQQAKISESKAQSLYQPLVEPKPAIVAEDKEETKRIWRATSTGKHVPTSVIGLMVHKAIELWCFPDDPRLIPLLESAALNAGLAGEEQRVEAVRRAHELLGRLNLDPFWETLKSAEERHHEIPYSRTASDWAESGYIDLLYRMGNGWYIVDFKTDSIRSDQEREELIGNYYRQLQRYQSAVKLLIGQAAQAQLCFLDDTGKVRVIEVSASK